MDTVNVSLIQFLSRRNVPDGPIGDSTSSPSQRPDIVVKLTWAFAPAPFEITFLDPQPATRPKVSIGADQYVAFDRSRYLRARWPTCIQAQGTISSTTPLRDPETAKSCLTFLNTILNRCKDNGWFHATTDQLASVNGYRWSYFQSQMFSIDGRRRPSHSRTYSRVKAGDFTGPGLEVFDNINYPSINEMGWSQAIPFPGATDIHTDLPAVQSLEDRIALHINANEELAHAETRLLEDDIKGCVRFAGPAVEARLRFWCDVWGVPFPQHGPFDDKIEQVLTQASKSSYRAVDPVSSERLLYLYRARNSSHEADCYYNDTAGRRHDLTCREDVQPLLAAAREFCVWIDALV